MTSDDKLLASVNEAIKDSLPEAHAGVLKKYIQQAERDKDELERLTRQHTALAEKCNKLENLKIKKDEIESREKKISKREHDCQHREEMLKLREQHAKERVEAVEGITKTVFQSNRMGYNINVRDFPVAIPPDQMNPNGCTSYGSVEKHNFDAEVDKD